MIENEQTTRVQIILPINLHEICKYLGQRFHGLNKSSYIRKVLTEHANQEMQDLTDKEMEYLQSNIKIAKLKQDIEVLDLEQQWLEEAKAKREHAG